MKDTCKPPYKRKPRAFTACAVGRAYRLASKAGGEPPVVCAVLRSGSFGTGYYELMDRVAGTIELMGEGGIQELMDMVNDPNYGDKVKAAIEALDDLAAMIERYANRYMWLRSFLKKILVLQAIFKGVGLLSELIPLWESLDEVADQYSELRNSFNCDQSQPCKDNLKNGN